MLRYCFNPAARPLWPSSKNRPRLGARAWHCIASGGKGRRQPVPHRLPAAPAAPSPSRGHPRLRALRRAAAV